MSRTKKRTYHLECSVCKNRNYKLVRNMDAEKQKLAVKKYCKHCQTHTDHIEVR